MIKAKKEDILPIRQELLDEYNQLNKKENIIKQRKKEISDLVKKYAKAEGNKDDKGSYYCEDTKYIYGALAKKSISIDQSKAKQLLENMQLWNECKIVTEKVDEDKLEKLVNEGKISMEELEQMTNTKVSYQLYIKEKEEPKEEEMPQVVEQVASKKPTIKFRRK